MRRIAVALALLGIVSLVGSAARAHAFLDRANPAVGGSVPTSPAAVELWFTQELEPAFSTATVTDKSGNRVDTGGAKVDPKDPTELRVPLKSLPPGTYKVSWRVVSVDTHPTEGDFTFEVGGG
jgi:copper resistance protein C